MVSPIKDAASEDAEAIALLDCLLFPANCFNERTLRKQIERGPSWVCYQDEELVGYLIGAKTDGLLDILRFGVRFEHRRKGLGSALVEIALEENRSAMLTVRKTNIGAIRLYKNYGFLIVGHLVDAEDWLMKRN